MASTTSDAAKVWFIANLKASSGVLSLIGGASKVMAWGSEVPASVGVFVGLVEETDDDHGRDTALVRIRCVANGEQAVHELIRAVADAFRREAGSSRSYPSDPSASNLQLSQCKRIGSVSPERDGPMAGTWAGTLTYRVRGRTTT